jgi:hypothetical protein
MNGMHGVYTVDHLRDQGANRAEISPHRAPPGSMGEGGLGWVWSGGPTWPLGRWVRWPVAMTAGTGAGGSASPGAQEGALVLLTSTCPPAPADRRAATALTSNKRQHPVLWREPLAMAMAKRRLGPRSQVSPPLATRHSPPPPLAQLSAPLALATRHSPLAARRPPPAAAAAARRAHRPPATARAGGARARAPPRSPQPAVTAATAPAPRATAGHSHGACVQVQVVPVPGSARTRESH